MVLRISFWPASGTLANSFPTIFIFNCHFYFWKLVENIKFGEIEAVVTVYRRLSRSAWEKNNNQTSIASMVTSVSSGGIIFLADLLEIHTGPPTSPVWMIFKKNKSNNLKKYWRLAVHWEMALYQLK